MRLKQQNFLSLVIWIITLIVIGGIIGSLTKPEISTWYNDIKRSSLTPPNYVFPIAWTILYGLIAIAGWLIWHAAAMPRLKAIKNLYVMQMILNWSWTPIFFHYHLIGLALIILIALNMLVGILIIISYSRIKTASWLLTPYLLWSMFAGYLNYYIWWYN